MTARNMTAFQTALNLCGLTRQEAAKRYDVSPHTVDAWARGVRTVPISVWTDLSQSYAEIERDACFVEDALAEKDELVLKSGVEADDKQLFAAALTSAVIAALRAGVPVRES